MTENIKLGASTKSFGGMSVAECADLFSRASLSCCELCFCQSDLSGWKYNLCGYSSLPSAEQVLRAAETFKSRGIELCALGVYNCFWNGNGSVFYDSVKLFCEYCDIASECGIKVIATHGGATALRAVSGKFDNDISEKLKLGFALSCAQAKKKGLTVSVEYGFADILHTYSDFSALSDKVSDFLGSDDMLKVTAVPIFCDANVPCERIGLFHVKDRKTDGRYFLPFGSGDANFDELFRLSKKMPDIPLVFEYINRENILQTAELFRKRCGSLRA